MVGESSFFVDPSDDDLLESRNHVFWEAMLDNIRKDGFARVPERVLDIGCHRGGLLARIAEIWGSQQLWGIEPIPSARARAQLRLTSNAQTVRMLAPEHWKLVPGRAIDLIVCHEVLFTIPDLRTLVGDMARVLASGGRAYIVAGCHAENPLWFKWREALQGEGREVYTHDPLELMKVAGEYGLTPSVRPLREAGWATYDPSDDLFAFPSVASLLDHQFRHKLLFRFTRK